ncbi:cation diffusion facilitator family transporter [Zhongshania aquimaris]|uniref:Cation diffusion facilitator family transporter n=1 Tax=Zhongshania aquimaris TaxID=2857107 RepID=A0ABS6VT08_9GAMM|nr:cation diffusion facilitator family transporter [Zhongshania aquimaris]MBW2941469.1 cation diffusion facilitator family transporter [Zhongshania aquimaris]
MHDHHHHHTASERIGWAFALNFCFTIIEFIGGCLTNSTAIMADAVHDLGDCLAIGMAWWLNKLGTKEANKRFSYGFSRLSLLGALINGVILVLGSLWVLSEAIPRLMNPQMPDAAGMLGLSVLGIAVNGFAAYKLNDGKTLNERMLNWHLLEDVLGWLAIFLVSIVLMFIELPILDPVLSIGFTLFILFNVAKNLTETLRLFLQATPDHQLREQILENLAELEHVSDIHHLHLWSLDGEQHVLTAHLLLKQHYQQTELLRLKTLIASAMKGLPLSHTTIEFEFPDESCRDDHQSELSQHHH